MLIKFSSLFILLGLLTLSVFSQSRLSKVEAKKWQEDLRFLAAEMPKKHANLFHTMKQEDFMRSVSELDKKIPKLARHEIIIEMARIVAMVGDGHTILPLLGHHGQENKVGFWQFPIALYLFKEGLFVKSASANYKEIVGGKIIKIGKTDITEVLNRVSKLVSRDNEMTVKDRLTDFLTIPEVLHALKLSDKIDEAEFVVEKNGEQKTIILKPSVREDKTPWVNARETDKTPLWLKSPFDPYWFEYLADSKTVYFQYNVVGNKDTGEKLPDFFKRLLNFVETNDVERLIIDLRLNSGGNGVYNWGLIYGIIRSNKINVKGKLFTIIGRQTFSAGVNAATLLGFHTKTIFVGEETGGKVNNYGDHLPIKLPNSEIEVLVAPNYYQTTYPWDKREWVEPNLKVEISFEDFRQNRDVALDLIFNYQN